MTKKEKIINMFIDKNGWKTGIRNGLTILQIIDKLGIKPNPPLLLRDVKKKVIPIVCGSVQKYFSKKNLTLCGLPFSKRQVRIYFIPETQEEVRRCQDYFDDQYNKTMKRKRYEQQEIRNQIRRALSDPWWSEYKERFQVLLDKSYERMDD